MIGTALRTVISPMQALLCALLLCLPALPATAASSPAAYGLSSADRHISWIATRLAGRGMRNALDWLREQQSVRDARLVHGAIRVRFTDEAQLAILPRSARIAPMQTFSSQTVVPPVANVRRPRALLLKPFESELQFGQDVETSEVDALTRAGFAVDVLRNSSVTVAALLHLAEYSLVVMETHSNDWGDGDAIIMTAETDDTPYIPLLRDGSVIQTTIAGQKQQVYYNAITSTFFANHVGTFHAHSILFFNGCSLLKATRFWTALQGDNVGALIGWDEFASVSAAAPAGVLLLNRLAAGDSVAGAVNAVARAGLGTTITAGNVAHLGYLGDGKDTLQMAEQAVPPDASDTALSVTAKHTVNPGSLQVIKVRTSPGATVVFHIAYPSGDIQQSRAIASAAGLVRYAYVQPASRILPGRRVAKIRITSTLGDSDAETVHTSYHIGYGIIDVAANPRWQLRGSQVTIWVHTFPDEPVSIDLSAPSRPDTHLSGETAPDGWVSLDYLVPPDFRQGEQVTVWARVSEGESIYPTRTDFVVD